MDEILDSYREIEASAPERIDPMAMAMAEDMFVRLNGWEWFAAHAEGLAGLARRLQFPVAEVAAFDDVRFTVGFCTEYASAVLDLIRRCAPLLDMDADILAGHAGHADPVKVQALLHTCASPRRKGEVLALPDDAEQVLHHLAVFCVYGFALYYVACEGRLPVLAD